MSESERLILIAEDDPRFRETLAIEFEERGYQVRQVSSLAEFAAVADESFDFAVVDLRLGYDNGLDLVERLRERGSTCRVVMLTGFGSIATAVRAMKLGAINYLTKPTSIAKIEAAFLTQEEASEVVEKDMRAPSLARHEREYIESVLTECDGNITRAALVLGLHRQSLQRKLRKFTPA